MSKATGARIARGRRNEVTREIKWLPPSKKLPREVSWKGVKFVVWVDSPQQIINPKKAYEKLVKESNAEFLRQQREKHEQGSDTAGA